MHNNTISPVKQATAWLILVAIFLLLTFAATLIGQTLIVLTGAILVTGIATSVLLFRMLRELHLETQACKADARKFSKLSRNKLRQIRCGPDASIFARVVQAACHNRRRGAPLNLDALMAVYVGKIRQQIDRFVLASRLLTAQGMFGTVWGLTISIFSLSSGMGDAKPEELSAAINGAIGGMGLAFVTTLVALGFSGLLITQLISIARSQSRYLFDNITAWGAMMDFGAPGEDPVDEEDQPEAGGEEQSHDDG